MERGRERGREGGRVGGEERRGGGREGGRERMRGLTCRPASSWGDENVVPARGGRGIGVFQTVLRPYRVGRGERGA
jgi:hypothetical protein